MMPELPEVETMVRDLAPRLTGRTVTDVEATFPELVVWPDFRQFQDRLQGQRIEGVTRRGKYAVFALGSGDLLIVHRGMTGSLLLRSPGAPMESHVRLVFHLDDGRELRFDDQRKFGKVFLMDAEGTERPLPWAKMGPEPLNGEFTSRVLQEALSRRTALIKPLLLNQNLVAGLGNIYVDEALYLARIHPKRRANTLTRTEVQRLHGAIVEVLRAAVERRGTTFSSYVDFEGRAGQFQESLRVFRRDGASCGRCRSGIVKLVVGGRGTHICPRCQKV